MLISTQEWSVTGDDGIPYVFVLSLGRETTGGPRGPLYVDFNFGRGKYEGQRGLLYVDLNFGRGTAEDLYMSTLRLDGTLRGNTGPLYLVLILDGR